MRFVVADWETFYSSKDYTLNKMSTEAYIRDPRFEAHGIAIKWGPDTAARWYDERQARYILAQEDWSDTYLIHHHAAFDSLIESHHYNVHPKMIGCTLSMARLMLGNHLSVSLEQVRRHFGMPSKLTPYSAFDGKKWEQLDYATQQQIAEGACDEVESIWTIFCKLMKDGFPKEELYVIDTTVKMFSEPVLRGDIELLANVWEKENREKATRLTELGVTSADLQSAEKFAALLRDEGVEPATKPGKANAKTGKPRDIYAFAKTDQFMRDLLDDDSPRVRTLAEARLGEKSTLLQTRAATLGWMARRGSLPVYLRYAGAHTTRWSGGDGCLTGDTKILVLDISGAPRYKNIIDVLITDLVWDGEEFVEHDGVQFSGYREVISWNGVNGTPEHKVCCQETWQSLSEALRKKAPIMDCREPTAWEVEAARAKQRTRTVC